MSLLPYLLGGGLMWFLMLKSGVHATIAGVLLAFAIPFSKARSDGPSPSLRLEKFLHAPVAFFVLPVFALANTALPLTANWAEELFAPNSLGIIAGLVAGKPLGITILSWIAVKSGYCRLPAGLDWRSIAGAGILGGIGFTMSIFIANLAFPGNPAEINASKMGILVASMIAGAGGYLWLRFATAYRTDPKR
jgi:NhaA family Na+:H+ antiporter